MEEAWIVVAETACGDQQRYRHWYRKIHWESVAEALNQNLAREFTYE